MVHEVEAAGACWCFRYLQNLHFTRDGNTPALLRLWVHRWSTL